MKNQKKWIRAMAILLAVLMILGFVISMLPVRAAAAGPDAESGPITENTQVLKDAEYD